MNSDTNSETTHTTDEVRFYAPVPRPSRIDLAVEVVIRPTPRHPGPLREVVTLQLIRRDADFPFLTR